MEWTLVTGGAKRLGAEISRTLASKGHNIVVHYSQSEKEATKIVQECLSYGVKAQTIQGDFSTSEGTAEFAQRYLAQFPDTANLVNNVGNYLVKSALNATVEEYGSLFQTNLFAPIILIQVLVTALKQHKGCIVNLGVAGLNSDRADVYSAPYTMTKKCLLQLTQSLALELAADGVRVNMVSPGYIDNAVDLPKDPSKLPMKRAATEHEVARVVAFLLEKESEYITGQNIEVAGGVRL